MHSLLAYLLLVFLRGMVGCRKRATQLNKKPSIIAFILKYTPLTITLTGELAAVFAFACVIQYINWRRNE